MKPYLKCSLLFIAATPRWHRNHYPRWLLPAGQFLWLLLQVFGGGRVSIMWAMATTVGAASWDAVEDLCSLPLFRDMAFFCFNFSAGMMGSGVMAATVSTDGAAATAVEVGGMGCWLPSHSVLPWRLVVAAAWGWEHGYWPHPCHWACCCWLFSTSFCSRARMRAMVSCSCSVIC